MTSWVSSTIIRSTTSCSTFCFTAKEGSVRALRMLVQKPSSPCRSRSSCSRSWRWCWCRYDWQDRHAKDIREGLWYQTRFASPQGVLIPLTSQECLVVYRAKRLRRRAPQPDRVQQLLLFELVATG